MSTKELPPEQAKRVLDILRGLEVQAGGNRSEVARRLKMSAPSVSNLLNGKNAPSFETAMRAAAAMSISVWTALGIEPPVGSEIRDMTKLPNLVTALEIAGDRASPQARANVLHAAACLPDLATPTWLSMLFDPAHDPRPFK